MKTIILTRKGRDYCDEHGSKMLCRKFVLAQFGISAKQIKAIASKRQFKDSVEVLTEFNAFKANKKTLKCEIEWLDENTGWRELHEALQIWLRENNLVGKIYLRIEEVY